MPLKKTGSLSCSVIPVGTTVASLLRERMKVKQMTVSRLSRDANTDRVMLTNILNGSKPPLTRKGHCTASRDPRYERIARCLDIEPRAFIRLVEAEQGAAGGSFPYSLGSDALHSPVWLIFLARVASDDDPLLVHVRYFHGALFACIRRELYSSPSDVTIPAADIRRRGLFFLAHIVHETSALGADRVSIVDRLYALI